MSEAEVIERLDLAAARNNHAAALSAKTKAILAGMGLGLNVVEAESALREQLEAKEVIVPDGADLFDMIAQIGEIKGGEEDAVAKIVFGGGSTRLEALVKGEIDAFSSEAFRGFGFLRSADILSAGIKQIGDKCFLGCTNLERISLGSVETIVDYAFQDCSSLKEISFPNTLWYLGMNSFYGCRRLEKISFESLLPDTSAFMSIEDYAFELCDSLNEVHFGGESIGAVSVKSNSFATGGGPIQVYFGIRQDDGIEALVDEWGWPSGSVLHFSDGDFEIA